MAHSNVWWQGLTVLVVLNTASATASSPDFSNFDDLKKAWQKCGYPPKLTYGNSEYFKFCTNVSDHNEICVRFLDLVDWVCKKTQPDIERITSASLSFLPAIDPCKVAPMLVDHVNYLDVVNGSCSDDCSQERARKVCDLLVALALIEGPNHESFHRGDATDSPQTSEESPSQSNSTHPFPPSSTTPTQGDANGEDEVDVDKASWSEKPSNREYWKLMVMLLVTILLLIVLYNTRHLYLSQILKCCMGSTESRGDQGYRQLETEEEGTVPIFERKKVFSKHTD